MLVYAQIACEFETLPLIVVGFLYLNMMDKPILIEDLGMIFATDKSKHKSHMGIFECPYCQKHFRTEFNHIKNGTTTSCSCYKMKRISESHTKHGKYNTKLYKVFRGMVRRTTDKNAINYPDYGGRGIGICEDWKNDFMKFWDWSLQNGYKKGLKIDRIDNDKNYSPDNCRWVTPEVNAQNQRLLAKNNTSGYRGVGWHKGRQKWTAVCCFHGKNKALGRFNNPKDAAIRYNQFVIQNGLHQPLNPV